MKISTIRRANGLYIREEYNEAYIRLLRDKIDAGESLALPQVCRNGKLMEGRHTVRAYELNGFEEILVEIVPDPKDDLDAAIISTKGHTKSKLPLLPADYIHTFIDLMLRGFSTQDIVQRYRSERLLTAGQTRKYVLEAQSRIWSQKLGPALRLYEKGEPCQKIADELGIDKTWLQKKLIEITRRGEERESNPKNTPLSAFKKVIRNSYNKLKKSIDYHLKAIQEKRNAGKITNEEYKIGLEYALIKIKEIHNALEARMQRLDKELSVYKK
jgi:hypothetical protein